MVDVVAMLTDSSEIKSSDDKYIKAGLPCVISVVLQLLVMPYATVPFTTGPPLSPPAHLSDGPVRVTKVELHCF